MSDASAARSTVNKPARSSTPCAASGFVSVLLTKTLRSSTLKLALICVGVFGAVVCALFGFVYCSTSSYVLSRSDRAIAAEHVILRQAYDLTGRHGLIAAHVPRSPYARFVDGRYLRPIP